MSDAVYCAHLPTTGAVYRVQLVRVVTTRDAPVQRYVVCSACHDQIASALPAAAPVQTRERWHITETAARHFARLLHDAGGRPAPRIDAIPGPEWQAARAKLERLAATATYREQDRQGRTLWRSPPSAYGLRWVVAPGAPGQLGALIWVGMGKPPQSVWQP